MSSSSIITWQAVGGYELAVDAWTGPRPVLRCRTAAGRELKKLPVALRDEPLVRELSALADWIGDHTAQTLTTVERWMTQSLPVPAALIRQVWPDPCWRRALRYAVVAPVAAGAPGAPDVRRAGVLTGVAPGPDGALLVTGLDGDRELDDTLVVIPHPALLDPRGTGLLANWRKLLHALDGEQGIEQLHRAVYVRPDCSPAPGEWGAPHGLTVFGGAEYPSGAHFERVVTRFGGRIDGEQAGFAFGDRGRIYRMKAGLRYQGPLAPVDIRNFSFAECGEGHGIGTYDAVPPPVWSEGIRAMAALYDERDTAASAGAASQPADSADGYQSFLVACARYAAQDAPRAAAPLPPSPVDERRLLDAGAVLPGDPKGPDEEPLTARRYASPLLTDDGDRFVRLLVRRTVEAQDTVARTLGLEPDAGDPVPVGRAPVRPLDFVSRVCAAHPELVREAMGLLAALHSCAKTAGTKPGRAANQLRTNLKKATAPHPELLPYALDEGARIVAEAGSPAMARTLYTEARAAEKRTGHIDERVLRDIVAEFSALGVVDPTALARYRDDRAARTSPEEAHEAYRLLVLEWCRGRSGRGSGSEAGSTPDGAPDGPSRDLPASFAVELAKGVGGRPAADDVNTQIFHLLLRGRAFEKATVSLWEAWTAPLERDLAEHPDTAGLVAHHMPQPQGSSAAAKTTAAQRWLALLARVGLLEWCTGGPGPVSAESARRADAWLTLFLDQYAGMRQPVAGLEPVLEAIATRLREAGATREPLLGLRTRSLGGDFWGVGVDLALHALMQRVGMPFGEPGADRRIFALQWLQRQGSGEGVEAVLADPAFRAPIRAELTGDVRGSLGYTVTRHSLTPFPEVTRQVAALPPLRDLMADILDERSRRLKDGGPGLLFALQDLLLHVEPFVVAGAPHPFDAYVQEALAVDPATLLADTLRARCLTLEHDDDASAACGLREVTVDHARRLLRSTDATLRNRHADMFAVEPAVRRSRYLTYHLGTDFAYGLLPKVERWLPKTAGDACRTMALGVVQGVLWCEMWQETLRRYIR
ncbi:DUF4132 domain-containing protein [Streptomyces sp. NPDC012769]|uniref:DUF4132 domain-containing protein n=1 Tax=Streptomyces sp. NPDC012769 TaxID=3364848 RepID=UPI0036A02D4A